VGVAAGTKNQEADGLLIVWVALHQLCQQLLWAATAQHTKVVQPLNLLLPGERVLLQKVLREPGVGWSSSGCVLLLKRSWITSLLRANEI
jgi:hypothetical protein